jgi:ribosomal protein S18 acetylase RimI-like enzyme
MNDFRFAFLSEKELPVLHQTFLKAFADYLVPIQLTEEQLRIKIKRENIELTFCAAAYAGEEMAGFILTGLGEWNGKPTAYNAGTGVIPAYRGHHLSARLYKFLLRKLSESGIEQCLLEVIQENKPAIAVYENTGFEITRVLDCFRAMKQDILLHTDTPEDITIAQPAKPDWEKYRTFGEIAPLWQSTEAAFKRYPDTKVVLEAQNEEGEIAGYVAFFPKTGALVQMAVNPDYRNRGIGSALLRKVVQQTEARAVMLINVDTAGKEFIRFLERRNFTRMLVQHEMARQLE